MLDSLTAGALRAWERSQVRASCRGASEVEPVDLLGALLDEPESLACELLLEQGLDIEAAFQVLETQPYDGLRCPGTGLTEVLRASSEVRVLLSTATAEARSYDRSRLAGTEHLLRAILSSEEQHLAKLLGRAGLSLEGYFDRMKEVRPQEELEAALPLAAEPFQLELISPADSVDLARILDASLNRASEGLRVVEDYVRFVLEDASLTRKLKDVRHRFGEAARGLDLGSRINSRDTTGDVGTHIMTPSEQFRESPRAVLAANFSRVAESMRSLEEYSKLVDVWLSGRFEVLRYDTYTLEKLVLTAVSARKSMENRRLYLLVGGLATLGDLTWVVGEALEGGVDVVQLREKGLPDREILTRAREIRIMTAQARAIFVLNDRPDLARLAGADGVHLGQEDLAVRDARRIVGTQAMVGVSTHELAQVEKAVLEGASYLGVGPVFASDTKSFENLAGLRFVQEASEHARQPWFAIGGINEENLDQVLEAGAQRIAISSAITRAEKPRVAARAFRERLGTFDSASQTP